MKLFYDGKQIGEVTTNRNLSIEEACALCDIDLNEESNGDPVWDCELFEMEY
jgi:hypothetical protein